MSNPNGWTSDEAFHERLRRYEQRMHPHYGLRFDGKSCHWRKTAKPSPIGRRSQAGPGRKVQNINHIATTARFLTATIASKLAKSSAASIWQARWTISWT